MLLLNGQKYHKTSKLKSKGFKNLILILINLGEFFLAFHNISLIRFWYVKCICFLWYFFYMYWVERLEQLLQVKTILFFKWEQTASRIIIRGGTIRPYQKISNCGWNFREWEGNCASFDRFSYPECSHFEKSIVRSKISYLHC